ncbi:L-histidine N(alpha)-methyltransferase [Ktedonospora formicarum]|uniref:Dimethylhistidine N-methyltransferase n=1 Tax=Ktedonospora formicarum TaxID=2778364 RepID=A0A8J3HR63_9CHLR|nr:L-histidine N(alpha)-methyltransferase [Ktedonospora formicarum]GHO42332.1 dimethylhistidine N-methyltransferase [Ktedonospora formicarum]
MRQHLELYDFQPSCVTLRQEVIQGLQKPQKELPSKYLYDEVGSKLFSQICELEAYYPTRTELQIMDENMEEIAALLGTDCLLIEYGSGSSLKTRRLLNALNRPTAYVPIDISKEYLMDAALELALAYPDLEVLPVCADYTGDFPIPVSSLQVRQRVGYFPGSTIGNFDPDAARDFLWQIARTCAGGGLLIGVDLKKDFNMLHLAYNDPEGITARFNLNLLTRLNQELATDFQLDQFGHYACYNPGASRIEMHLVSLCEQTVHLEEWAFPFRRGESIWTESSYKYTLDEFASLAVSAGFCVERVWTDPYQLFSIQYLSAPAL